METKYAVVRDGQILVESSDLDYLKQMKEELSYRQTGRTTRMLFQALGDPTKEVVIVCGHRYHTRFLMDRMCEILEALDFKYIVNTTERTIVNFGKTYYFISSDNLTPQKGMKDKYNGMAKYLDEK